MLAPFLPKYDPKRAIFKSFTKFLSKLQHYNTILHFSDLSQWKLAKYPKWEESKG